jgi:hypothetical protein
VRSHLRNLTERGLTTMHVNRGLLFWGLALITAGATVLAVQQGYVDADAVREAWRLWPVILIAIGLSIVLARTPFAVIGTVVAALVLGVAGGALFTVGPGIACTGDIPADAETSGGEFAEGDSATVDLDFNCGELAVGLDAGRGWTASTAVAGSREVELRADGTSLTVQSSDEGGFDINGGRQRWDIGLGSDLTYEMHIGANAADVNLDIAGGSLSQLSIDPNAGSMFIDLSGATVEAFEMSMNAGSADLLADAATSLQGSLNMNAGSFELCAPTDAALRIAVEDNVAFSHNLEARGLTEADGTWTSEAFAGATQAIDLRLEGNAASFTLNPDGGCL